MLGPFDRSLARQSLPSLALLVLDFLLPALVYLFDFVDHSFGFVEEALELQFIELTTLPNRIDAVGTIVFLFVVFALFEHSFICLVQYVALFFGTGIALANWDGFRALAAFQFVVLGLVDFEVERFVEVLENFAEEGEASVSDAGGVSIVAIQIKRIIIILLRLIFIRFWRNKLYFFRDRLLEEVVEIVDVF